MQVNGHENMGSAPQDDLIALILDRVPTAIALFDRDMRYLACNDRWISDFSLPDENIIGRSHFELMPETRESWRGLLQRALAGETLGQELDRFEREDGTIDWMRWSISPWPNCDGAVQGILWVSDRLTPQIQDELRTRVLSEELNLLIDTATDFAICMLDEDGRVTIWNDGAERLFGWTEAEVRGKTIELTFDSAGAESGRPWNNLRRAKMDGVARDRYWRVRRDGSRFMADVTVSHIEADGVLPGGFGYVVRDVTEQITQSRRVEASAVLLNSILQTVPDPMIVIDDQGLIQSFSATAQRLFGYTSEEVLGRNVSMLMPPPDCDRHDEYLRRYRETGKKHIIGGNRRVFGRRKDGSVFPHTLHVGEATGGGKRVFAGFLRDLTETEMAETRLLELQRELAHIARVSEMGTLATTIAHELNQPLMAITNFVQTAADLLDRSNSSSLAIVTEALREAGEEAIRAGEIVKRLRSFVSRGELERSLESPAQLVTDACKLVEADAKYREIDWTIVAPDSPSSVLVDRVQIQQVILNLLRNAIDAIGMIGKVEVRIILEGEMVRFEVSDNGPGVPEDRVERLFEPFSTSKKDGMGMGLAICRSIVEAHGGQLWYQRNKLGGAEFIFALPRFEESSNDVV